MKEIVIDRNDLSISMSMVKKLNFKEMRKPK